MRGILKAVLLFLSSLPIQLVLQAEFLEEPKPDSAYRDFSESSPAHVKAFYRMNHAYQTVNFVQTKKAEFLSLTRAKMSMWQVIEMLGSMIDESDPDMHLPQCYHSYQTAEALRKEGMPRWLILVGFIHDLGKILAHYGEPQWAVVGDTFPVGCAFSDRIVFAEYFAANPDSHNALYQSKYGIYAPHCGFENVLMSWGHDEYLYHVIKDYVPREAAYIVRFHSFYAAHRDGAYQHLMSAEDVEMMPWLKLFSHYDLYSKEEVAVDVEALKPYYKDLVAEFFPAPLNW